jgi:hypothetical protein
VFLQLLTSLLGVLAVAGIPTLTGIPDVADIPTDVEALTDVCFLRPLHFSGVSSVPCAHAVAGLCFCSCLFYYMVSLMLLASYCF